MSHSRTLSVPAATTVQADLKAQALQAIVQHLNLESLQTIAAAARKPGADAKLKTYKPFL